MEQFSIMILLVATEGYEFITKCIFIYLFFFCAAFCTKLNCITALLVNSRLN